MTESLNIFKKTEEILFFITSEAVMDNMPRLWLHTIYPKMVQTALELHSLVYMANSEVDERESYLKRYISRLNELKALTRLAHERKMLSHTQADRIFESFDSVFRQANAWKRKTKAK